MNSADTWTDQTWNSSAGPYFHPLVAPLLLNGAPKLCQPPELPSAPEILGAAAINIHVGKTGSPPAANRQDLFWTTIPAKSSDRPGEPCLKFIPFFACILERISPAPRAESNNHHGQSTANKHNLTLALDAATAMLMSEHKSSLPIKYSLPIEYLGPMENRSYFNYPYNFIEIVVPHLAWLCWIHHPGGTGSPASAIGHA